MIVVSVVGVLATLAIFSVRAYLASAKTADAKEKVGAISRSAVAAYERARVTPEAAALGVSAAGEHQLCDTSTWVPAAFASIQGRKYQPNSTAGQDFDSGDDTQGWKCLRFTVTQPMYYRLHYDLDDGDWDGHLKNAGATAYFVAQAEGDTDGDGTPARFQRGGVLDNDVITTDTELWVSRETE